MTVDVLSDLPKSYELLKMDSQMGRYAGPDAGDTPLCFSFRSDSLRGIWDGIVSKTEQKGFEEFRGAFLVALGQYEPDFATGKTVEDAWNSFKNRCGWGLDMNYIPTDTFEVRVEDKYSLSG